LDKVAPRMTRSKASQRKASLNRVAIEDSGHVMASLLHFGGLAESVGSSLSAYRILITDVRVDDGRADGEIGLVSGFLSGRGQGASCGTHSKLSNWRASFRDHGRSGDYGGGIVVVNAGDFVLHRSFIDFLRQFNFLFTYL